MITGDRREYTELHRSSGHPIFCMKEKSIEGLWVGADGLEFSQPGLRSS